MLFYVFRLPQLVVAVQDFSASSMFCFSARTVTSLAARRCLLPPSVRESEFLLLDSLFLLPAGQLAPGRLLQTALGCQLQPQLSLPQLLLLRLLLDSKSSCICHRGHKVNISSSQSSLCFRPCSSQLPPKKLLLPVPLTRARQLRLSGELLLQDGQFFPVLATLVSCRARH